MRRPVSVHRPSAPPHLFRAKSKGPETNTGQVLRLLFFFWLGRSQQRFEQLLGTNDREERPCSNHCLHPSAAKQWVCDASPDTYALPAYLPAQARHRRRRLPVCIQRRSRLPATPDCLQMKAGLWFEVMLLVSFPRDSVSSGLGAQNPVSTEMEPRNSFLGTEPLLSSKAQ